MITLKGDVLEINKKDFESDGVKKTFYDVLVNVGRAWPEVLRFSDKPTFDVDDSIELDVRSSAYSRSDKKYLRVVYYPLDSK